MVPREAAATLWAWDYKPTPTLRMVKGIKGSQGIQVPDDITEQLKSNIKNEH